MLFSLKKFDLIKFLHIIYVIIKKDLWIEYRSRTRINTTFFFSILTLLLFSFALGPEHKLLAKVAPGFFWLAILLSSILSLNESMRIENENLALEGLVLLPLMPSALFLAKALVNMLLLVFLSLCMLPVAIAIYGIEIKMGIGHLFIILLLGNAAISAPGTLYAGITLQSKARDVLLPLLLFPVLVPSLLALVKATSLVLQGDPMQQLPSWKTLLIIFVIIYWFLGALFFGRVIDD